jgi:GT2 family glycosyltransferase
MMDEKVLTCIIILNWNGYADTVRCVQSVFRVDGPRKKIIIVDNGSQNNEYEKLTNQFGKKVDIIALPKNYGYAKGCNIGITYAKNHYNPQYYLLLNNDTEVECNFLSVLTATAAADKHIGIVSPVIYDFTDRKKIVFAGGKFNMLFARPYHITNQIDSVTPVEFITGCSMLVKNTVINRIGLLDERYFSYFEDADYSVRVKKAGFIAVCDPKTKIYHKVSAATNKGIMYTYLMSRNRILFVNFTFPILYRIYFFWFNFFKLIAVIAYFFLNNKRDKLFYFMKGYYDGNTGRSGYPKL